MIDEIVIDADGDSEEIKERLRLLLTTHKGTMPMDRSYGIDLDAVIDKPLSVAQNCYATEVIGAVSRYETGVNVISVVCEPTGEASFRAVITLAKKEAQ